MLPLSGRGVDGSWYIDDRLYQMCGSWGVDVLDQHDRRGPLEPSFVQVILADVCIGDQHNPGVGGNLR